MRKILACVLMLLLALSLAACGQTSAVPDQTDLAEASAEGGLVRSMPGEGAFLGASGPNGVSIGSGALSANAGRDGAQTVWYAGESWTVIGYDGDGNPAAKDGAVTLLLADADGEIPFTSSDREVPNAYKGSDLEEHLNGWLEKGSGQKFSDREQAAVAERTLDGGSANHGQDGYDGGKVKGDSVDASLWPLSSAEAEDLPGSISESGSSTDSWLRSPGDGDGEEAVLAGNGTVRYSAGIDSSAGVRPAFDLDPDAVLLVSTAEAGKVTGTLDDTGIASGEWKVTLKDDGSVSGLSGHTGFAVSSVATCDGKTLRVSYGGASSGSNEYISALVTDASGAVSAYGILAPASSSSGSVEIDVDGRIPDGGTLYLFNEQVNGFRETGYASGLIRVSIPDEQAHDWKEATCTEPRTCTICGATEGEPSGHSWKEATCTEPKTCTVCGATEGDPAGHVWGEAACTEPRTCTVCGASEGEARGHEWKDATCTEPKTCTVCGATEGDPAGHRWKDATCTEPKTCEVCGATEGDPAGHSWKEATCTEPKICTVCGAAEGDPAGHKAGEAVKENEKAPGCEEKGSYDKVVYCTVCHEEISREKVETEPTGHSWDEGRITTRPGCEEKGIKTFTCKNDASHTKTEDVEPTGHDWDEGRITTKPGCEEKGVKTYTCKNDASHTKTEDVEPTGHDWDDGKITTKPTCEEKGVKTFTCKNDASHTKTEDVEPLGHKWNDGRITKDPTCEEKGEKTFVCQNDNAHTKTEEVDPLGHDFGEWKTVKEPGIGIQGERQRVCSRCDRTETEPIDALKGYTVTFDTNGGSAVASQTVAEKKQAAKPKDPTRDGFVFDGWYADKECRTPFDFSRGITADTTVYAGWKDREAPAAVTYDVTEDSGGTWTKGSGKSYTVTVKRSEDDSACFSHYVETQIDGKTTAVAAKSGSTVITISGETLEKLGEGTHTITVRFNDGKAETALTVQAAPEPVGPDDKVEPAEPDEKDEPVTPDEPDKKDEPAEPDDVVPADGGKKGLSPWLIVIPVVLIGGGAGTGVYLAKKRRK